MSGKVKEYEEEKEYVNDGYYSTGGNGDVRIVIL
jgi:hypothetical protein